MPFLHTIAQKLALSSMILSSVAALLQESCGSGISTATASVNQTIKDAISPGAATLLASASVPKLPSSSAVPDLNSTFFRLVYVALGHGIQNYICESAGESAKTIGAIATLYDVTHLAYTDLDLLHTLPAIVVNEPVDQRGLTIWTAAKRTVMPVLGNHFFDINGTPVFDLSTRSKILYANKTENVKAPATASKGPMGIGAVDWLKLIAKFDYVYTSVGLETVYRVETAGGIPTPCNATSVISIPYAAEYWFYA